MDKREIARIMNQGAVRPETPRDRAERRALETDLADSPLRGRPLEGRLRNFRPDAANYLAALSGPLPWMRRLREIEALTAAYADELANAWRELAGECDGDASAFSRRWRAFAAARRFDEINDLIERHNRFYPAEARLPMDPRTRDFVKINGKPYRREPLDARWVLARFPPALERAAA